METELSFKLSRRLQIEGPEDTVAVDVPGHQNGSEEKPTTANADSELGAKLRRRGELNEGLGEPCQPSMKLLNPYTEFKEFSRNQIKDMEKMFKTFDAGKDNYIDLMELKLMMEKLGAPQTHIGLKNMIKEVDEDLDNKLSFREFLLIFRKAAAGELAEDSGLSVLARLSEIDVSTEGVKGAKTFFEAKLIQNAAARLVCNLPKFTHTTLLLRALHRWPPVLRTDLVQYTSRRWFRPSMSPIVLRQRFARSRRPRRSRSRSRNREPLLSNNCSQPLSEHFSLLPGPVTLCCNNAISL